METVAEVQEEVFGKIETEDIAKLLKEVREQKESTSLDEIEVLKPYVEKVNSLTDIGDLCASSYVALGMLEDETQVRFLKLVESVETSYQRIELNSKLKEKIDRVYDLMRSEIGGDLDKAEKLYEEIKSEFFKNSDHPLLAKVHCDLVREKLLETREKHSTKNACQWTVVYDSCDEAYYTTACGNEEVFIEGMVTDNKYKHCPYCGKPIEVIDKGE